jgi:N-acetylglutamate synthase-like GNAT family acetyltransferase
MKSMFDQEINWRDYSPESDKNLDLWIASEYHENVAAINKYAFFHEPLSKQYLWYQSNPHEMSTLRTYFKIAEMNGKPMACFILNYGINDEKKLVCGINPFVVNPNNMQKGYGNRILMNFIKHSEIIINDKIDVLFAGIDESNLIAKHIFTKNGFIKTGSSKDGKFGYYQLLNF